MKKIVSICFLLIIALTPLVFVGCGASYSREDVNTLYNEILSFVGDEKGFVKVNIDESKTFQETTKEDDKAYIFPFCYDNFLSSSAGLFFEVASRQGKDISYTLRNFTQEELNSTYEKLKDVRDASITVASNKSIFESSNGNLKYQELVVSCNNLIEKLNTLNDYFSPAYFSHYYTGYTTGELSDGELKDVLAYGIQALSSVSYNYELKNFEFSNPYGEIMTWYNGTTLLKKSNERIESIMAKLRKDDLTTGMSTDTMNNIIAIIQKIQNEKDGYASDFAIYQKALNKVDIVKYFKASNKTAYRQSLDKSEQSCFELIDRFLGGRYEGMSSALSNIEQLCL